MANEKNPAQQFREGIQADAERYLVAMLGTTAGRAAGARVAMAFSAAARSAKKPETLYDCSRASIVACIAMSALTGLMPGGPNPSVYLVPKGGELQWWLTHRGISALALRAGWQVIAIPVHKDDEVEVQFGEVVRHEPDPDKWADSLDDLRGCYVTIRRLSDGVSLGRPWMPIVAIKKRAKKAQSQDVWREWAVEQAQKTVIKWAMARGYLPIESAELAEAMSVDEGGRAPEVVDEPQTQQQPTGRHALGLPDPATVPENHRLPAPPIEVPAEPAREPELVEAKPKATSKPKAAPVPVPSDDDMP